MLAVRSEPKKKQIHVYFVISFWCLLTDFNNFSPLQSEIIIGINLPLHPNSAVRYY